MNTNILPGRLEGGELEPGVMHGVTPSSDEIDPGTPVNPDETEDQTEPLQ